MKFNIIEEDLAKEIVNIGLAKAADSFSFFTREKVLIRSVDFQFLKLEELSIVSHKKGENIHLLSSEIKGDMSGWCFLIFSESEALNLFQISLPESMFNDPVKYSEMGAAVLKEADNIITASVLTQFSNLFNLNTWGHVPELQVLGRNDMIDFIASKGTEGDYVITFTATFVSDDFKIGPEFFWILDDKFVQGVRGILSNCKIDTKVS